MSPAGHPSQPISPAATAKRYRLAYVVSHPIQYQAPMLRAIAADPEIDLTVFFCSDFSLRAYRDHGFGTDVSWEIPLTEGYRHVFLPRWRETSEPGPTRPIVYNLLPQLRQAPDGRPYDALWVHGYASINSLHAIAAARLLHLPVLLRTDSWLGDRVRSQTKLWIKRIFMAALRPSIAGVLTIGTLNGEYWSEYFGSGVPQFLLPYAVDNEFFRQQTEAAAAERQALQAELGLAPERPVILFAGKLQQRKHCDHLLLAYIRLLEGWKQPTRPVLLIVGDGEQRRQLADLARKLQPGDVIFAGFRNQKELPRFFDLADVFVLPSRHEPWGLAVNEAMAAGLPVVVSDQVGCAPDLVASGENGFVYPFGDIEWLAAALGKVLQPGEPERMGARSQERIAPYSIERDVAELRAALDHIVQPTATI